MNLKDFCAELGIDYTELTGRFMGMEDLCLKFIKKFVDDSSYADLQKALIEKDYTLVERFAHTLKGISANLSFSRLFDFSNQIVQDVRNNMYDNLEGLNSSLTVEYKKVIDTISKLD